MISDPLHDGLLVRAADHIAKARAELAGDNAAAAALHVQLALGSLEYLSMKLSIAGDLAAKEEP